MVLLSGRGLLKGSRKIECLLQHLLEIVSRAPWITAVQVTNICPYRFHNSLPKKLRYGIKFALTDLMLKK